MQDGVITATLKGGSKSDSPWIVLRADSWQGMKSLLEDSIAEEAMSLVKTASNSFANSEAVKPNLRIIKGGGSTSVEPNNDDKVPLSPEKLVETLNYLKLKLGTSQEKAKASGNTSDFNDAVTEAHQFLESLHHDNKSQIHDNPPFKRFAKSVETAAKKINGSK